MSRGRRAWNEAKQAFLHVPDLHQLDEQVEVVLAVGGEFGERDPEVVHLEPVPTEARDRGHRTVVDAPLPGLAVGDRGFIFFIVSTHSEIIISWRAHCG